MEEGEKEYMLQIQHICKEYRTGNLVQKALDDVSLTIPEGSVSALVGSSGSGKSTLVKRLQEAFVGDDVVTLCHDYSSEYYRRTGPL